MRYPFLLKIIVHNTKYILKKSIYTNNIFLDWSKSHMNFGDILNPYIIGKLTNRPIINVSARYCLDHHLLAIGSILGRATSKSIIWGSGFISSDAKFSSVPHQIYAVRGPLTRKLLLNNGVSCPEIYGDPALLVSKFYKPKVKKEFRLGILAHYSDKDNKWLNKIDDLSIKIIDIQNPNPLKVIDDIFSCDNIASSSLHGLIISDSYQIPSVWIKMSDKIVGGNFKFHDYFLSINSKVKDPIFINEDTQVEDLIIKSKARELKIDLQALLSSFPDSFR